MEGVGTLMRHVLELMDGDVARFEAEMGLTDYRPRFSPVVRTLVAEGPMSIRDLARHVGVTHSAASQTVASMTRSGLVSLRPGTDARQRIVHLTPKARRMLPTIEAAWEATAAAQAELDRELPLPLATMLHQVLDALERRSFYDRIDRVTRR
jgi:DNA-binding MarR family transcriptional regulator